MAIPDTDTVNSAGWWLKQLYTQLIQQRAYCQKQLDRYMGNGPLPIIADNQRDSVKWFVGQSRTNFERLIVDSVLPRLRLRSIRTAAGTDDGGDSEAFRTWRQSRGKLWSHDVHRMMLSMSRGYVIVGKDAEGELLVTAEDPRMVTAITDPENPYRVLAGLKVYYNDTDGKEYAYLYLPGEAPRVATADINSASPVVTQARFLDRNFAWLETPVVMAMDESDFVAVDAAPWLAAHDGLPALCPIVPFVNQDGVSEFSPFIPLLDRINQQILQRMTIATIQAFKQRAFKGLPQKDPITGKDIDWNEIFVADPGAIWNIPEGVEIWESGQVDLNAILMAVRDDIKDLAAVSGLPLYTINPDSANGSAEGASLQREQLNFRVEGHQDRLEISHEIVAELIFRTLEDAKRSAPGGIEIIWAPIDRPSMAERASAIAQTTGVMSRYKQLTDIWQMTPDEAAQNMVELKQDFVLDQAFAAAATPQAPVGPQAPTAPQVPGRAGQTPQQAQQQAAKAQKPAAKPVSSPKVASKAAGA